MKTENVKVGQRVRVRWAYRDGNSGAAIAVVMEVRGEAVRVDNLIGWFHCSQLRLLKPKKKQPRVLDGRRRKRRAVIAPNGKGKTMTPKPNIARESLPGSKLLRACDCFTVFCRHNMRELSALTRWERFKLFFIRGEVHWDSEEGVVSLWKRMGGVLFLVKQEPIEYGDPRNAQIDRFHGWFS